MIPSGKLHRLTGKTVLLGGSTGNATQQMDRDAKTIHTMFGLGTGTQSAQQFCKQLSEPLLSAVPTV